MRPSQLLLWLFRGYLWVYTGICRAREHDTPSQRPWPFSNPFHNAHAHASALSPLQQASVAGSGSDGSPDRMAEVNEALKKQVALIASLSAHIQQSSTAPGATGSVEAETSSSIAPIMGMLRMMHGNVDGAEKIGAANVAEVAKVGGLASRWEGPGPQVPGGKENHGDAHRVENGGGRSPCEGSDGYTFPTLFGSPKEQRTPDARPAEHESHHTIQVPARQQRSNSQVPRDHSGSEKRLKFLLPETPVDATKQHIGYGGIEHVVDAQAVEAAEIAVSMAAMTPGGAKVRVHGDENGRPQNTPGKVASTPIAIEVLSQMFNHSQQASYQQHQSVDRVLEPVAEQAAGGEDWMPPAAEKSRVERVRPLEDEDAWPCPSRGSRGIYKPRRTRNRPRSSVKEKAARAASLAVARPKKPAVATGKSCNCKKSQCLKMYCDCFAASGYCHPSCTCESCRNTDENEDVVNMARAGILLKDPTAFDEKVDDGKGAHRKGCRCKRSKCLKKYCECYQAGIPCNEMCQCVGCANCQEASMNAGLPGAIMPTSQPLQSMQTAIPVEAMPMIPFGALQTLHQVAIPLAPPSVSADQLLSQPPSQPPSQSQMSQPSQISQPSQPLLASQNSRMVSQPSSQPMPQLPYQMVAVSVQMPDGTAQVMAVPMQLNGSAVQALQGSPANIQMPGNLSSVGMAVSDNGNIAASDSRNVVTPRGTQDSEARNLAPEKVLAEKTAVIGSNTAATLQIPSQQFRSEPHEDSHPSHLQSQTPVTDAEAPSPLPLAQIQAGVASKSRRMTNMPEGINVMPDWRQFSTVKTQMRDSQEQGTEKENKRPRRKASSGVAAAAAAAKLGVSSDHVGFEQRWDTITPPCRVRRKRNSSATPLVAKENSSNSVKDIFADHPGPVNVTAKNYPKKAEARMLLLQALEKQKEVKTKEEEVDAATALFSLAQ